MIGEPKQVGAVTTRSVNQQCFVVYHPPVTIYISAGCRIKVIEGIPLIIHVLQEIYSGIGIGPNMNRSGLSFFHNNIERSVGRLHAISGETVNVFNYIYAFDLFGRKISERIDAGYIGRAGNHRHTINKDQGHGRLVCRIQA